MYIATIKTAEGTIAHKSDAKADLMACYRWASVQGKAGHDWARDVSPTFKVLTDAATGEPRRLEIEKA
ncbi:hypothetical protein [Phaeobacter phage MD18]|nr:hypothetical protein [Phaeobacter phage MD18]